MNIAPLSFSKYKIHIYELLTSLFGGELVRNIYLKSCIRRQTKSGVIFIHIPKSAGSSISQAVIGRRAGHFTAQEVLGSLPEGRRFFSFSVVRDPVDRLISSYLYAISGGGDSGSIKPNPIYKSLVFQSFDSFLHEWLSNQKLSSIDPVFRTQSSYIFDDNDRLLIDYLGKIEEVDALEHTLSTKLCRKIEIPHINKNKIHNLNRKIKSSLTNESLLQIERIYWRDYKLINYPLHSKKGES